MYKQSDTAAAIRRIQDYLFEIHLHEGLSYIAPRDGIYGNTTREAIREFQGRVALPMTGIVDLETFEALRETALKYCTENACKTHLYSQQGFPLRSGSRGADVDVLHALLRSISEYERDLPPIPRTSYYSEETAAAVRYMQNIFQIDEDGIVDAMLFDRLENDLAARRVLHK